MSDFGIKTKTEYTAAIQTSTPVQSSSKTSAPNSVMTEANKTNAPVEEKKNTSKLDVIVDKIFKQLDSSKKLKKQGIVISKEEIMHSGLIEKISSQFFVSGKGAEKFIENLNDGQLEKVVNCIARAITDNIKDGKVDYTKVGKTASDYMTAVATGWTINGFKEAQTKNQHSLFERLKTKEADTLGLLKNYDKIEDVPPDVLEKALDNFFNNVLLKDLKTDKQTANKIQLQTFGRLLVNTPQEEKAILLNAVKKLADENKLTALDTTIKNLTQDQKDGVTYETVKDVLKDGDGKMIEAAMASITSQKTEKSLRQFRADFQTDKDGFLEAHKDVFEAIKQKEANGEELTPEEQALKELRDKYTRTTSGIMSGSALNNIVEEDFKKDFLAQLNKDAFKDADTYKNVMKYTSEFIEKYAEEHPELMTLSKEEITKLLDEATNGNYSAVASGSNGELKAPVETKTEETAETPDYGFTQDSAAPDTTKLEAAKAKVYSTADEDKVTFTVDKQVKVVTNPSEDNVSSLQQKLAPMNNPEKLNYIAKHFNNLGYKIKKIISDKLKSLSHSTLMLVLSQINSDSFILSTYKQLGLSSEDIQNLNISTGVKNLILSDLEKQEQEA